MILIGGSCIQAQDQAVQPLLKASNPANIKIVDHLGEQIDLCINKRVKTQNVQELIAPFYNKTETHFWQSEFLGKWMLGAILSYRYTNDPVLLDSIKTAVNGLLGSQSSDGYIGNYAPENQLTNWDIWGRKYSMLGLLSYYDLTGDKKALEAVRRMADHLLSQVGEGKVNIVATGNYFGMASSSILEPMVFLYNRTKEKRYLDFAKYIVAQWETEKGPKLISKALAGAPVAERSVHPASINEEWFGPHNGQKAYEMMSCYEGLAELYKVTGDPAYLSVVEKTVQNIMDNEINIAGSGAAFECWYFGKQRQAIPAYHTMETCVTITWMKLCLTLLTLTGNPVYADQIETTAYNALLASMKADGSEISKYSPLEGLRHAGEEQCYMHINCCNANGPRGFGLLTEYAVMTGDNSVYLNLYSGLNVNVAFGNKETNTLSIREETNYPIDGKITLFVDPKKAERFTLALRIPSWSENYSIDINGQSCDAVAEGNYCKMDRMWNKGDVVTLNLDVRGRVAKLDNHFALMKGPVVLARDTRFKDGFIDETARISDADGYVELKPVTDKPQNSWLAFSAPLVLGTDLEGDGRTPKQIKFCDFASAGNTWESDIRYKVWLSETLNVMNTSYKPY
jgi:DUF1680 family protein